MTGIHHETPLSVTILMVVQSYIMIQKSFNSNNSKFKHGWWMNLILQFKHKHLEWIHSFYINLNGISYFPIQTFPIWRAQDQLYWYSINFELQTFFIQKINNMALISACKVHPRHCQQLILSSGGSWLRIVGALPQKIFRYMYCFNNVEKENI